MQSSRAEVVCHWKRTPRTSLHLQTCNQRPAASFVHDRERLSRRRASHRKSLPRRCQACSAVVAAAAVEDLHKRETLPGPGSKLEQVEALQRKINAIISQLLASCCYPNVLGWLLILGKVCNRPHGKAVSPM